MYKFTMVREFVVKLFLGFTIIFLSLGTFMLSYMYKFTI